MFIEVCFRLRNPINKLAEGRVLKILTKRAVNWKASGLKENIQMEFYIAILQYFLIVVGCKLVNCDFPCFWRCSVHLWYFLWISSTCTVIFLDLVSTFSLITQKRCLLLKSYICDATCPIPLTNWLYDCKIQLQPIISLNGRLVFSDSHYRGRLSLKLVNAFSPNISRCSLLSMLRQLNWYFL